MKRTKRKKSLYWRVRSPFVAILLVVSMLAEIAITVQAVDSSSVCACNKCVTQEIVCEQCADCVTVEERGNPEVTTEEPTDDGIAEEKEVVVGKEEPKETEETEETKKTEEVGEPKEDDVVKEKEEAGKKPESTTCPTLRRAESRGKHTIRYGYFTSRGRAAVDELVARSNRGADFARNLSKAQLGIDQELTYVLSTDVSLGEGEVFPVEGITVAIPASNVACGETVVVLHYIESQGIWEALSGTVENGVVFIHLMSFSPVVVYLAGTPWANDAGMSEALSVIPENAVRLEFTENSPNGKTMLEFAFMSINEDGSMSLFFLVSSNQKQLPLVMSYAGYGGRAIGQIGNNNSDNNVKKYVAYQVDIVLDGIRDISTGIVDISTGQGGHTINGGKPITFTNINVQVQHYRMDVDVDGSPFRVTTEVGVPGTVFKGSPVVRAPYGYKYSEAASEATASGIVPFSGTLVLKLYYQRDEESSGVIVIEGPHVSIPYDGREHSLEEIAGSLYTVTFPGEGYSLEGEIEATNPAGRDVGRYNGAITLEKGVKVLYEDPLQGAEMEGPEDVTNLVDIIRKPGSLTIIPSKEMIVVTAGSAAKAYDGNPLTCDDIEYPTLPPGATHITAEVEGSQTEIGSSVNRIVEGSVRIWNGEEDVTLFFSNIETRDGLLTVTRDSEAPIIIWAKSASKIYDGIALTESGFGHSKLPKGITHVEATVVGSQTNAGRSSNVIPPGGYKLFDGEVEVTELFTNVTLKAGTLKVLPRPAMVTANSGTKKAATEDPADLLDATTEQFNEEKGSGFIAGEEPTSGDYLVAREPGEASGIYKVDFVKESITYKNSNYKVTWIPGTLVIEANRDETHEDFFAVTIIANSHISIYDGNVKVAEGIEEVINPNEDLDVKTMTLAAKGVNVVDSTTYLPENTNHIVVYKLLYNGSELHPDDVVVHVKDGTLEILPATVTITALSDTIVLGQAIPLLRHMIKGIPVNGDELIHNVDYHVAHVDLHNAVGTYPIVVTVLEEANPNYIIEVVHGQLVIWIGERRETPTVTPPPENPPPNNPNPPEAPNPPEVPFVPTPPETPATPSAPAPTLNPPVTTTSEPTGPVEAPTQIIETPAPLLPPPEVLEAPAVNEDGTINYATIPNDEVPLAAPTLPLHWALVNLLLSILTVIIMLLLMVTYFTNKREEEEENTGKEEERDQDKDKVKRKGFFRLVAVIVAIVSVVVFILTEDMRLPMVLIDRWTLLMAIIALIQVVVALISKKKYEDADAVEEVEEQMA